MPKRTDLKRIMIIGAGPIVVGQGCEFDYSGSQGVKSLKAEGYEVVLVNSNPATIMTDPGLADRTYIEPIESNTLAAIVRKERPCAILPTLGGQTALNAALDLAKQGVLDECKVELIGVKAEVIEKAESRDLFAHCMEKIGLKMPASGIARNLEEVRQLGNKMPFPLIIRPAFTLGGTGGGIAYNFEDLEDIASQGLAASPTSEVMIEQSVLGWKELEMELVSDKKGNCIVICSIENLDPMGVHTGDSITVAPVQTLTLKEYERMVVASKAIMAEVGVETGGANIQFALNPADGELVVIEMNPRVSRSSALASKATGFPIAKISAKLAVGYTLDELKNDITQTTSACFEPSIDYCVLKIPRFTFEKFPGSKDELTTAMKSVGEAMSIGRTFKEALQKGLRSMEFGKAGLGSNFRDPLPSRETIIQGLRIPNSKRIFALRQALLAGFSAQEIFDICFIDPWFTNQIKDLVDMEHRICNFGLANDMTPANTELRDLLYQAKEYGFSDVQLAEMWKRPADDIRQLRKAFGITPEYGLVDTCSGEFSAITPYYYSTYERPVHLPEAKILSTANNVNNSQLAHQPNSQAATQLNSQAATQLNSQAATQLNSQAATQLAPKKIIILGGGPNRIGQGIEFDYCCCHASFALKHAGAEAIMVNSNPETVSTDYDTSTRLYFEPLTFEDVMHIVELEQPDGVIVQFGGQTPLNLAVPLLRAGVPILGTSPDAIDRAEDRERFQALLQKLQLRQPDNGIATSPAEAKAIAQTIGYPVVVRPSYVLGGRAMAVVYDESELNAYFIEHSQKQDHPILIDKFLEQAIEVDVDALSDGKDVYVAGIMEHIEEAGIHSGDSACALPPFSLTPEQIQDISQQTQALAKELRIVGLMNIQFAIKNDIIYILEVNPRASRTAPFVAKATGVPLPYLATQIMLGQTLQELNPWGMRKEGFSCVKEAVFPFNRFPGVDIILGPEMRSTGEVMGMGATFEQAFLKSQLAAGQKLPQTGKVFISVNDRDKPFIGQVAKMYAELGFKLLATTGTANLLRSQGLEVESVFKVYEGRPNIVDAIKNNQVSLIINTASGKHTAHDSKSIRHFALIYKIPHCTTVAGAKATARSIGAMRYSPVEVQCLQEYYAQPQGINS